MISKSEETRINAELWRTSLRLEVQNDAVFIVDYNAHRPWNIVEGHGREMTKGKMRCMNNAA